MAGGSGEQHYALGAYTSPGSSESKSVTKSSGGKQVSVNQQTYRAKNEEKQTGSYERFTAKDKYVSGETFVERGGRVEYKDEHTTSATYKVGDKSVYTEYYREEKVKHVNFDNKNSNQKAVVGYYPKYNKY